MPQAAGAKRDISPLSAGIMGYSPRAGADEHLDYLIWFDILPKYVSKS